MFLLVHTAFIVAELEVVRRIKASRMRKRLQIYATLDFQKVLLGGDDSRESIGTSVNLLRPLFQVVCHGHHAQTKFARHFHIAGLEFGKIHRIEVSALLVEHVVDGNHATTVIHLRNAVRTAYQRIQFGIVATDSSLQLLQVGLYRLELGSILYEDGNCRVGKR